MDLQDYFEPVSVNPDYRLGEKNSFGSFVDRHLPGKGMPDWGKADMAIFGIPEYRGSYRNNSTEAADRARKCLYELAPPGTRMKISDLGNLRAGRELDDTLAALRDIVGGLLKKKTVPLLFGGDKSISLGIFRAYESAKRPINLTTIDSRPGMGNDYNHHLELSSPSYLNSIITSKSKYLFNYTNIGYQSCFTTRDEIRLLDDLMFDAIRLGIAREDLRESEPLIRDTDMLVLSLNAIRQADAPAALGPSPNGFPAEEFCQLAWYGGKSERVSSLAICDWHGGLDNRDHTSHLAAQVAWYFIDGYYQRKGEYPFNPSKECTKFIVNISGEGSDIVFYKSSKSERWWMEVPSTKLPRNMMVACSHEDYLKACRQEVPERWWQIFRKVNH